MSIQTDHDRGMNTIGGASAEHKKSTKRINSKNWQDKKGSKMSDLFMEGMGCEPTAFKEIGVKVPKMGIITTNS